MKNITIISQGQLTSNFNNGGFVFEEVFFLGESRYKISIKTESHVPQSYAVLSRWTGEKGFSEIIKKNPKEHYGECPAYCDIKVAKPTFDKIKADLLSIAQKFEA